jgi:VWFA-related protein
MATTLSAQTRETIEVQVMEIEVTVLDRNGKAVEGLKPEDFQVRVGRRAVPVKNFFAVRNGAIVEEVGGTAPAAARALANETTIPTNLVIFIDETHLRQGSRKRALDALQKYVAQNVGPMTMATLIRFNKSVDVRTRPTEKPGYILAELEKLEQETFLGHELDREREMIIGEIDEVLFGSGRATTSVAGESPDTIFYRVEKYAERRTLDVDRTLAGMEEAIDLVSGFAGRKVLLYVSEGLPQQPGSDIMTYWDDAYRKSPNQLWRNEAYHLNSSRIMRFDRTQQFQRVANSAQRARVAIYSFDAAGVKGFEGKGAEHASTVAQINTTLAQADQRGGLQFIADETGGRYIKHENDVDKVLAKMSEQFSTFYSIGIAPRRGDIDVTVKNRPGVRVYAARRQPPRTRQQELEQNLRARLYTRAAENPLNARLEVGTAAQSNGDCIIPLRLEVPQPKISPPEALEVQLVMVNERNDESEVRRVAVPIEAGRAAHAMTLRVQPQHHVLSIAVANPLSGEASYLQQEVDGTTCRR